MDDIIATNMGLVYKQLHRFNLINDDEALSQAMEALWVAAKTFDASKNVQFSTYATACIYNALAMYIRSLNKKRQLHTVSYNEPLCAGSDVALIDVLADTDTLEDAYIRKELMVRCKQVINEKLDKMPVGNQKKVILEWLESGDTTTQTEIAERVGISQAQVSRIIRIFKYQVRKELEDYQ